VIDAVGHVSRTEAGQLSLEQAELLAAAAR
jgi:hypothetical protein